MQPKLVYEAPSFDAAYAAALPQLQRIESELGVEGNNLRSDTALLAVERELMKCYASGTELWFDPVGHTYIDAEGVKYESGSVFAGQFEHEFNKDLLLPRSAAKLGITDEACDEYWQSKGDISTTFGTSLHKALEHYGKWKDVIEADIDTKTGKSKGTGIHPTLEPIVLAFFKDREDEVAVYEPFVADPNKKRCGQIDRLLLTGDKRCWIEDYKTNGDLYKKGTPANLKAPYAYLPNVPLSRYMIQLSFYKSILEAHGWTVEGLRVHHWAGKEWKAIEIKSVEIDKPQTKIDVSKIT